MQFSCFQFSAVWDLGKQTPSKSLFHENPSWVTLHEKKNPFLRPLNPMKFHVFFLQIASVILI